MLLTTLSYVQNNLSFIANGMEELKSVLQFDSELTGCVYRFQVSSPCSSMAYVHEFGVNSVPVLIFTTHVCHVYTCIHMYTQNPSNLVICLCLACIQTIYSSL